MERYIGFVILSAFVGYTYQQCALKANPLNPGNYLESVHGTVMDRACAPGLVFDQVSCTCTYAASPGISLPVSDIPQLHTAPPNAGAFDTDPLLAMLLRELQQPDQTPPSIVLPPPPTPAVVPTSPIEPALDHQTLLDLLSPKSRAPAFPSVDTGPPSHRTPQTLSPSMPHFPQLSNPGFLQFDSPPKPFASPPEKPLVPVVNLPNVQTSTQSPVTRSEPQTQPSDVPKKKTSKSKKSSLEMFQDYLKKKGMKVNLPFLLPVTNASDKRGEIAPSSDSKPVLSTRMPSNLPPEVLKLLERSRGPPSLTQTAAEERQSKHAIPAILPRSAPQPAPKPASRSTEIMLLDMLAKVGSGGSRDRILPFAASGDPRIQQLLSSLLGAAGGEGGQERISLAGLPSFSGGLPQMDMMSLLGSVGGGGGDFQGGGAGMVPGGGIGANLGLLMGSSSNLGEGGLSPDLLGVSSSSGLLGLGLASNTEITNLLNFQGALGAANPSSMSGLANIDPLTLSHLDRRDIVDVSDLTPFGLAQLGQGLGGLRG